MPGHHVGQRAAERVPVDPSGQAHHERVGVGGGPGVEPVEQPQPLLGRGQRDPVRARPGDQAGGGRAAGEQRQPGRRPGVEQLPQRQVPADRGTDPGEQPQRGQRVPAGREEVVLDPDRFHAERLGEQLAQLPLAVVARLSRGRGDRRAGRQRGGVQLAVDGERQRVDHRPPGRHHVGGQRPGDGVPHLGGRGRADQVGDERAVPGQHGRLAHPAGRGNGRFHLAQLDPVAPDLHLVVGAPEEVEVAVGPLAHEVAGAVEPAAVRPGHEPRGGRSRRVQVAAGQSGAADVELPRHARRHRPQPAVQDVAGGVEDRPADRRGRAVAGAAAERVDRVLGRAVQVVADHAGRVPQRLPELVGDRLAAEQHQRRPVCPGEQALVEQGLRVRGGEVDDVDPVPRAVADQSAAVAPQLLVADVHLVPLDQPEQLLPGHVEGEADRVRDRQVAPAGRLDGRPEDVRPVVELHVRQPAVGRHDALGTCRSSRRCRSRTRGGRDRPARAPASRPRRRCRPGCPAPAAAARRRSSPDDARPAGPDRAADRPRRPAARRTAPPPCRCRAAGPAPRSARVPRLASVGREPPR